MSTTSARARSGRIEGAVTVLTDGGHTRRYLEDTGVRFDPEMLASRWWAAVLEGTATSNAGLREGDDGAIVVHGRPARLEEARGLLAWAVSSARRLRVLAPGFTPATVGEEILTTAASLGLTVIPNAELPTTFRGGRRVTARVVGDRHRYLHALSDSSPMQAFDEAQSMFSSSIVGANFQAVVLPDGVVLDEWQVQTLNARGRVIRRDDLAPFLENL